uniref:Uncharacterized protein n=1 Tax=Anopheles atroparvus TaxID=41427 RepID=A0A182IMT0_ANOAO
MEIREKLEDAEADEEDGQNGRGDDRGDRGDINGEKEKLDEEHSLRDDGSPEPPNGEIVSILRKNGSLLQSQEISSSQQNFFRMLDQKIEEGPDYDSSSETEQALEEARLNALVQHWESASLTTSMCSSTSRSLQGTPVRQVPLSSGRTLPSPVQCLQMSYYQQQQQQQQQAQALSQQFQQQQQQQQSIPPQSYYNDILRHPMQLQSSLSDEKKVPTDK